MYLFSGIMNVLAAVFLLMAGRTVPMTSAIYDIPAILLIIIGGITIRKVVKEKKPQKWK